MLAGLLGADEVTKVALAGVLVVEGSILNTRGSSNYGNFRDGSC